MALVKKLVEFDLEQVNQIKAALEVRTDQEAIRMVIERFDTDLELRSLILRRTGTHHLDEA